MKGYPRVLRNRPRMLAAVIVGALCVLLLPESLQLTVRMLIGWDCIVWLYLLLIWIEMIRAPQPKVQEIAMRDDENAVVVLAMICLATLASVAAIVIELVTAGKVGLRSELAHYTVTGATLFGAWFLIPTIFTLHYARLYYASPSNERALAFPGDEQEPDYGDFLYFSFTIAVASQTADISLRTRSMRRAVFAQSILSFYFNLAVLGLSVNVAAGLLGS